MDSTSGGGRRPGQPIARGPAKRTSPPPEKTEPLGKGEKNIIFARVVDGKTQRPIGGATYEVVDKSGAVLAKGKTDYTGMVYHKFEKAGTFRLRVTEAKREDAKEEGGAAKEGGGAGGTKEGAKRRPDIRQQDGKEPAAAPRGSEPGTDVRHQDGKQQDAR